MAIAWSTIRVTVIAETTLIAVRWEEFGSAFALAATLGTVTGGEMVVAIASCYIRFKKRGINICHSDITLALGLTLANICGIQWLVIWPIEPWFAFMAVDALCVVSTVLAHTTTVIYPIYVQGKAQTIDIRIVLAFIRVSKTIASYMSGTTIIRNSTMQCCFMVSSLTLAKEWVICL